MAEACPPTSASQCSDRRFARRELSLKMTSRDTFAAADEPETRKTLTVVSIDWVCGMA